MKFPKTAAYIRHHRKKSKVSQLFLSRKYRLASAQYISNCERGVAYPAVGMIRVMAEFTSADPFVIIDKILEDKKDGMLKELNKKKKGNKK